MLPSTPLTGSQVVLLGWSAYSIPPGYHAGLFGIHPHRVDTTMSTFENIKVVEKIDEIDMMSPL